VRRHQEGLPDTETLYVNGTDNSAVQSTVTGKLQEDSDADVILGLGAPYTAVILKAVNTAGSDINVASFNLNATLATSIKSCDVLFTVEQQQPFMQGYRPLEAGRARPRWRQADPHRNGHRRQVEHRQGPAVRRCR
jgi:simple sugar transport system substrate-binding protein